MWLSPRGATLHQLTRDVWDQIGGKWVLFGHGGRETVSPYMGIFLEGLCLYGCVFREFSTIWVWFERPYTHHASLETESCEPPVASGLITPHIWVALSPVTTPLWVYLIVLSTHHNGYIGCWNPSPHIRVTIFGVAPLGTIPIYCQYLYVKITPKQGYTRLILFPKKNNPNQPGLLYM